MEHREGIENWEAMKKASLLILFCSLLGEFAFSQKAKHVVLISIDGLRPEMYLDSIWPAPNLRALKKSGTYAEHMLSVFPSFTYPAHTAMLTGALPARSGIYFNQPKNGHGEWNWFMKDVRVPTLWQVLNAHMLTTAAIEWPVSVGAGITWNIPEIWSDKYPDRITESRKYATPGLIDEIEKNTTGRLDSNNMNEDRFSMDANSARMAAYIFKTYHPALLTVHFAEVDGAQHEFGRDADSVRLAVAAVDRAVGDILETVRHSPSKDSTAVIIVGDHGFSTIHTVFRPNILISDVPAGFTAAGGSAFLYRKLDAGTRQNAAIVRSVTEALNKLPPDRRRLFRIIDRSELDRMGADSAALLALAANPGIVFSGSVSPSKMTGQGPGTTIQNNPLEGVFFSYHGGHHGYDPNTLEMYTGFIASGAGIVKKGHIKELRVTDIAPLVAALLGVEFRTPDGRLVPGILQE
ncbi:alkaline phosphatase family protein [Mucilaginibacter sp. Mucisp84]|uniref:alkaline phosphatase family protein n=1 Tax=Mucilaginibacter sp. Mucisp84 TaxID=3243058 RepID=UPI0039A72F75